MPLSEQIRECIRYAANAREMLVFVVGKSGSGKTTFLRSVAHEMGMAYLPVGGILSGKLLESSVRSQPLLVESRADEILASSGRDSFCVDNTEVLFTPSLHCDPIRLAFNLSRSRLILFAINGNFQGRRITHGYPDHPEYFSFDLQSVPVITLQNHNPELHEI